MRGRISVDVPTSDARRDRIERDVITRVAAMQSADRADAVVPAPSSRWWLGAGIAVAAAAIVAIVVLSSRDAVETVATAPSRVVTPAGGASRFTVGDAVIDAGSDTSVEVASSPDAGVTLSLARGSVDCDVAPRAGRPPFRVIAGDVVVEVVGTRFTVARSPAVRIDVARGTVHVSHDGRTEAVTAGESWPTITAAVPVEVPSVPIDAPPPDPAITIEPPPTHVATPPARTSRQAWEAAHKLAATDRAAAARAYRAIANGSDSYAALALFDLAELHGAAEIDAAAHEFAEYLRRFPSGANAEDAAWRPIELFRTAGRNADAHDAAARYLSKFPTGTYAEPARKIARP
jgi:hypothetical protein